MSLRQIREKVLWAIEERQNEIINLTKKLVQTPSENNPLMEMSLPVSKSSMSSSGMLSLKQILFILKMSEN